MSGPVLGEEEAGTGYLLRPRPLQDLRLQELDSPPQAVLALQQEALV